MDPFSIAGGAAQFLGLLVQIIELGSGLYKVFQGCKHAKRTIERMIKTLELTKHTVKSIKALRGTDDLDDDFENIMRIVEVCAGHFSVLHDHTDQFMIIDGGSKPSRLIRKPFFHLTRMPLIQTELDGLEKAKTDLSLALQPFSIKEIQKLRESNARLEISFDTIVSEIKVNTAMTSETLTTTQRIERTIQRVEKSVEQIPKKVEKSLQKIPKKVESVVRVAVREEIRDFCEVQNDRNIKRAQTGHSAMWLDQKPALQRSPQTWSHTKLDGYDSDEDRERSYITRRRVLSTTYSFPMGVLRSTKTIVWEEDKDAEDSSLDFQLRRTTTKNTFTPSYWLWRRRAITMYERSGFSSKFTITTAQAPRILPDTSVVFYACQIADLRKVKELFRLGLASPFDVDSEGSGLLDYCLRINMKKENCDLIEFLLAQGVDPAPSFKTWKYLVENEQHYTFMSRSLGDHYSHEYQSCRVLRYIGEKMFVPHRKSDALDEVDNLLEIWELSGIKHGDVPLSIDYFERDNMIGLHELVFSYPVRIFNDLTEVCAYSWGLQFHDQFNTYHDFRFRILDYLCKQGIKKKIFTKDAKKLYPSISGTCFCQDAPGHLLFRLLFHNNRAKPIRWRLVRRHVHRMLVLLLKHGEDPSIRCPCKAWWNKEGKGSRSLVCLAAEEGLLNVLGEAMEESGLDGTGLIDEWMFAGLRRLFMVPSQEEPVEEAGYECGCYCERCSDHWDDLPVLEKAEVTEYSKVVAPPARSYSYSYMAKSLVTTAVSVVLHAV